MLTLCVKSMVSPLAVRHRLQGPTLFPERNTGLCGRYIPYSTIELSNIEKNWTDAIFQDVLCASIVWGVKGRLSIPSEIRFPTEAHTHETSEPELVRAKLPPYPRP